MLLGNQTDNLGLTVRVIEPEVNREASNYVEKHYNDLIKIIKSYDIKDEKAHDLLHDVFISLVEAENDGMGFDMQYGEDGNILDVSQFVIGRIKLYSRNTKYRTEVVESGTRSFTKTEVYYETELDKNGQEILGRDGKPKKIRRVETKKVKIRSTSHAASYNEGGDIMDCNDNFQKAYAMAGDAVDTINDVTELISLREQIDYCIDVCELHHIDILNIFKNIDKLAGMLGDYSKKKKTSESVFNKISDLVEYNDELGKSLFDILSYSSDNRANFEALIACY